MFRILCYLSNSLCIDFLHHDHAAIHVIHLYCSSTIFFISLTHGNTLGTFKTRFSEGVLAGVTKLLFTTASTTTRANNLFPFTHFLQVNHEKNVCPGICSVMMVTRLVTMLSLSQLLTLGRTFLCSNESPLDILIEYQTQEIEK